MVYAEILAGGKGTKMGNTDMPKQFLMLGSKPIVIHTIEQFIINKFISKVIVCCPKDWMTYMNDLLEKYIPSSNVDVVCGGVTRNDTIINGCKFIEENYGLSDDDIIITHDAVRPFVTQKIINDNIESAKKYDAVDTVIPATDTIVESIDGKEIKSVPDRNNMYQGQTPQSFNIKKLVNIYNSLTDDEKKILTDACKVFALKKEKIGLVNGEIYNIKLNDTYDLKIANAILMERGNK